MEKANPMEKDTRSIVMKVFDWGQKVGMDVALERILKVSKAADELPLSRIRGALGDREAIQENIEGAFYGIGKRWEDWMLEVLQKSSREFMALRTLKGGLPVCSHIYYRLIMAKDVYPLLDELESLRKLVDEIQQRNDMETVLLHVVDPESNPILPVLPEFMEMGSENLEKAIRKSAEELAKVGDSLYGGLLKALYRIVNYCSPDLEVPDSVDELISLLSALWEKDDFLQWIFYEELGIVIDSELNGRTSFSPSKMEIAFYDRTGRRVGPLKLDGYIDMYNKYRRNLGFIALIPSVVQKCYLMDIQTGLFE